MRIFLILTVIVFIAGCSGEGPGGGREPSESIETRALPEGHPEIEDAKDVEDLAQVSHSGIKTQKEIRLSEEIRERWKEVELEVVDSGKEGGEVYRVEVGGEVRLKEGGFVLKVEAFVPDYTIFDDHIGSRSEEPNNPAVLIELLKDGRKVARGWVFKNLPDFNSYSHDRIHVVLRTPAN